VSKACVLPQGLAAQGLSGQPPRITPAVDGYTSADMQTLSSIVALNILHGGGKRTSALIEWLQEQSADIVVLSEWRNNPNGLAIEAALKSGGYHVLSQDRTVSNGVLIAARESFDAVAVTPPDAPVGVLLKARWKGGLTVIGAYFPLEIRAKRRFFGVCTEHAMQHSNAPFLLVGDLNTGCNDADLEPGVTPFPCADAFVGLTESGLIDQWRRQHGLTERQYTWRSRQNGFRIDHAFGNDAFVSRYEPLQCDYDHSTRETKLSDHSALVLRLGSSKTLSAVVA
jgi:exodeoxyribonuclease-3